MSELYVLDTDCFTLFQFGHEAVVAHAEAVDRLAITIVTVDESLTGWYSRVRQSKSSEQLAMAYRGLHRTVDALRHMEVLPYSQLAIEAQLRLRRQFRQLGKLDLAIAAIALEFNATLVTRNRIDFEQIPGLWIEDRRLVPTVTKPESPKPPAANRPIVVENKFESIMARLDRIGC